jgi:taurine--2-oxoglutarate transaminase
MLEFSGLAVHNRELHARKAAFDGELRDWIRDKPFAGGLTYSGHPLACASAVASIGIFKEEGIVENAADQGRYLADALRSLQERHPSIGEVRGLGLFWGLELVRNRETREPLVPFNAGGDAATPVTRLTKAALDAGLYLFVHWNVVVVCPPLNITRVELDEGLQILDDALTVADEYYS